MPSRIHRTFSRRRHATHRDVKIPYPSPAVKETLPRMRYLGPVIWTVTATGTFYLGFAAYDVYQDVQNTKKRRTFVETPVTWEDIQKGKSTAMLRNVFARQARGSPTLDELMSPTALMAYWNVLMGPEKLLWGAIGLNNGLFALSNLSPRVAMNLQHIPAWTRNFTLLTSTFGHAGLFHLGLNMYALYNFAMPVAASKTFEGSGSHLAAFYLSSGVMGSLAYHMSAGWPSPRLRLTPGLGASGAVLALLGAFAMDYPEAKIGVIFLPFTFIPAQQALVGIAVFETYGLFVGFKTLPFAHAAHLAGIAIGSAYVYFDGPKKVWKPARKMAFKQMKVLGII